jgi:hypothetical protein
VGAKRDDDAGESTGAAYVYRHDGTNWFEEQKLLADDAEWDDFFGIAVAIHEDVIVVGAHRDDDAGTDAGAAYVFRFDGMNWVQEGKLLASDGADGDRFGRVVSVFGNAIVVGARNDDDAGESTGAAYVFRFDGMSWNEEAKLLADDGEWDDFFGTSVSIHENVILVGAHRDDGTGSAYGFRHDGSNWNQEQKLTASDAAAMDRFGGAVSVFGNIAVVGADGNDDAGESTGAAYVFRYNGSSWNEEAKLLASDGQWDDFFGGAVSVSGHFVLVGAIGDKDAGAFTGAAYLFYYHDSAWHQKKKLTASDAQWDDLFGHSVSVSGSTILIGSPGDDDKGDGSGSAYVYRKKPNMPPVADPNGPYVAECRDAVDGETCVLLDGSASYDPDGDPITYLWSTNQPGASFDDATLENPTLCVTGAPLGTPFDVTLTVDDGKATDETTTTLTIRDTTPPTLTLVPSPDRLWPPNHKMVDVTITPTVSDLCDSNPAVTLISAVSSEPDNGIGDGNTDNDIQGADIGTADFGIALRAERSGPGAGRVYTLTYRATDASGNTTEASTTVVVPHNGPQHRCDSEDCDLNMK